MSDVAGSTILEIRGLQAGYWDFPILRGVSLSVPKDGLVTVIGPNGSGKSTLLKAIYGLTRFSTGDVIFHSGDRSASLLGLEPFEIADLGINYVPQLDRVFRDLSVEENLEVGAVLRPKTFDDALKRVFGWFPVLSGLLRRRAGTLSGGQQGMLALARALMSSPSLLLLDEPSAGLAPKLVTEVFEKIGEIRKSGISILIVEQNARQMLAISDYGYVLDDGMNGLEGRGQDLMNDPKVVELYLGRPGQYDRSVSDGERVSVD